MGVRQAVVVGSSMLKQVTSVAATERATRMPGLEQGEWWTASGLRVDARHIEAILRPY